MQYDRANVGEGRFSSCCCEFFAVTLQAWRPERDSSRRIRPYIGSPISVGLLVLVACGGLP